MTNKYNKYYTCHTQISNTGEWAAYISLMELSYIELEYIYIQGGTVAWKS